MDIYCVTSQLKGFPRTFPHSRDTPQSSLGGNLASWIRLETAGFAWSQNQTTTTSQHGTLQSGYLPVPVYFRRCPARWQVAATFAFPLFCCEPRVHYLRRPAHLTVPPSPLSSLALAGTKEWKAVPMPPAYSASLYTRRHQQARSSAGGRGWHQPSPAAASASLQLAIRFLPRSRGHLPHPPGCHLLKQIVTIETLIY